MIYLKAERIKKETERAYLLQCPDSNYSYGNACYWLSKSRARLKQVGDYQYLEVSFPRTGVAELTRFISKKKPVLKFEVDWEWIESMYRADHELVKLNISFQCQNQLADRQFEREMRY